MIESPMIYSRTSPATSLYENRGIEHMKNQTSSGGMRAFFTIWFGQLISLIGSQLTGFALGVWVYD